MIELLLAELKDEVALVSARFEELGWRQTPAGEISLRRRREPVTKTDVYEVKLGDEFLMSSLFTAGEIALAEFGLAQAPAGEDLQVIVGGLGLGYTALAVLQHPRVASLLVIEALEEVISWHQQHLVPCSAELTGDPRCKLVKGDFFALAADPAGFDPDAPGRTFHAILVDIDHTPRHWLHPSHGAFYTIKGLTQLATHLRPAGVFALWSNDPPDESFVSLLRSAFVSAEAHVVTFDNPLQERKATNTIYVATTTGL